MIPLNFVLMLAGILFALMFQNQHFQIVMYMGIIMLGPRIGKYATDGKVQAIPGHNMTAATIGRLCDLGAVAAGGPRSRRPAEEARRRNAVVLLQQHPENVEPG